MKLKKRKQKMNITMQGNREGAAVEGGEAINDLLKKAIALQELIERSYEESNLWPLQIKVLDDEIRQTLVEHEPAWVQDYVGAPNFGDGSRNVLLRGLQGMFFELAHIRRQMDNPQVLRSILIELRSVLNRGERVIESWEGKANG